MDWTGPYEALRTHALGEAAVGFVPLGLGVLRHRGVAAWMACEALAGSGRRPLPVEEGPEVSREGSLSPLKTELVRLLAGAALLTTAWGKLR